jgi:hypothetical protein
MSHECHCTVNPSVASTFVVVPWATTFRDLLAAEFDDDQVTDWKVTAAGSDSHGGGPSASRTQNVDGC